VVGRELKRKPRAKAMAPGIRQLIAASAGADTKREDLARDLIAQITQKFPKEVPPAEETVIKLISKYRNRERPALDRPWSLGEMDTMPELSMDAESINYVLKARSHAGKEGFPIPLTFRQAKWISRLYRVTGKNLAFLWFSSFVYANYEIVCEMAGTVFNTRRLDSALLDSKVFASVATELQAHELANEAFKKGFYFNLNKYDSEREEEV
jgi:hypothetical protein